MSQFSNQLQASIQAQDFTQTLVCEQTGVTQSQLSRYVNGENRPSPDALDPLLNIFNKENQIALLLAYLDDDIPDPKRNLVHVLPKIAADRVAEESAIYRSRMPRALRAAYDWLGADALVNQSTADWIIANYERLIGTGDAKSSRKESAA